jgi:ABC-2 type transport system permease protein
MVRILIALRGTVAQHQWRRSGRVVLVLALLVGLVSAGATFALGFVRHGPAGADGDVLAVVFTLWMGGQLAQAALAGGDTTLRPEIFALLPLPPRRLAWSLLVVGLTDPVLVLLLIAYSALLPLSAGGGIAAALTGLVAAVLTTALTGVLSTIVGGVLGPGARRGRDLGTIVIALALSVLALTGTLLPAAITALDDGRARWLTDLVHGLPPGWGVNAVDAARRGHAQLALGWLATLASLTLLAALLWPYVLRRRMGSRPHTHRSSDTPPVRRLLPANPTGAVCAKELRLWARDPVRLTCLLIAAIVGLGVALVPRVTAGSGLLMPFGGSLTVVIAGACACNLYGNDGTSLWLTVMTPDSARPDICGRQAAWLIIVAPFALVETVVLTTASAQPDLWPWAVALVIAVIGGATGLIPVASLLAVQPLDEAGNPTPGWSIKIHLALYATTATALPAAATLVIGASAGTSVLLWTAVPVAATTATFLAWWGQKQATRRLPEVQIDVLNLLAAAA